MSRLGTWEVSNIFVNKDELDFIVYLFILSQISLKFSIKEGMNDKRLPIELELGRFLYDLII